MFFMTTALFNDTFAQKYGGSAYVHVKDKVGNSRVLNTMLNCNEYSTDIAEAKRKLLSNLRPRLAKDEVFDSGINYNIESCDK